MCDSRQGFWDVEFLEKDSHLSSHNLIHKELRDNLVILNNYTGEQLNCFILPHDNNQKHSNKATLMIFRSLCKLIS